jgi:hypothetical protein
MVGEGTLTVGGSNQAVNDSTLMIIGGTLTSDGQHRLTSAITPMTQHPLHRHAFIGMSHNGHHRLSSAIASTTRLDQLSH